MKPLLSWESRCPSAGAEKSAVIKKRPRSPRWDPGRVSSGSAHRSCGPERIKVVSQAPADVDNVCVKGPWSWHRTHPDAKFSAQGSFIYGQGEGPKQGSAFGSGKGSRVTSAKVFF